MAVELYVLTSDTVLDAVGKQLRAAVEAWCADWGVARDSIAVDCRRAWQADPVAGDVPWRSAAGGAAEGRWLAGEDQWRLQLRQALFPPGMAEALVTPAALADGAADAALAALRTALGAAAEPGVLQAPPASAWRRGAGALLVRFTLGGCGLWLFMHQGAVAGMARLAGIHGGRLAPLAPVDYRQALGRVGLRLPLEVGRAEVGLGSLMLLGVGDVIRLDTLADLPLTVRGPGGAALFDGHLGLAGQYVALEVVRRN